MVCIASSPISARTRSTDQVTRLPGCAGSEFSVRIQGGTGAAGSSRATVAVRAPAWMVRFLPSRSTVWWGGGGGSSGFGGAWGRGGGGGGFVWGGGGARGGGFGGSPPIVTAG